MRSLYQFAIGTLAVAVIAGAAIVATTTLNKPIDPLTQKAGKDCDYAVVDMLKEIKPYGWVIQLIPAEQGAKELAEFQAMAGAHSMIPKVPGLRIIAGARKDEKGESQFHTAMIKDGCVIVEAASNPEWFAFWVTGKNMPRPDLKKNDQPEESD